MNYEAFKVFGEDLSPKELDEVPSNGNGDKEFAVYLKVTHDGEVIHIFDTNMEPEDATFSRGLGWVEEALEHAYYLGLLDGRAGE